jgi:hypothetical protein
MAGEYRPDVIVTQRFRTPTPTVGPAPLYSIIVGVNRQLEWKNGGQTFQGGQSNDPFNFPDLIAGSDVERDTATDEVLRPHVYLKNRFGEAEVDPSYDWASDPQTFELSPTLSAVFEIASGTAGAYSSTTGKFLDGNADFIDDEVAAGDKVLVDGVTSFDVTTLINDGELDVTRINKAGATWSGDLSALDVNGDRTFQDLTTDFLDRGFKVGDILTVQGWDILSQADGIDYSAEVTGVRTITSNVDYGFVGAGVSPPITGPPYQADIVWVKDLGGDWTPTFRVSANVASASFDAINTITTPAWPGPTDTDVNEVFEIYHYTAIDLDPGTGPLWTDTTGSYTAETLGSRTFTIANAAVDFTTLLSLALSRYNVVVHGISDAGGTANARPIFKVTAVLDAQNLTIENWDPNRPQPSATGAGVTWEIWDDGGTAVVSFLGADITVENPVDTKRTLTSTYNTFVTDGVAIGDTVFSDAGVALFTVTDVDGETILRCTNIVPGSPPSSWTDSEFGFYVADQTQAELTVTRVVDADNLVVREVIAASPPDRAFTDLLYTATVANVLSGLTYTIEKTLTGTGLTGEVLTTYAARRNDKTAAPFLVDAETYEDEVGHAVPANPLGLACFLAFQNLTSPMYCYQIQDDNIDGWEDALSKLKINEIYVVCPLTESEAVLGIYRSFVNLDSEPLEKREKVLFQCHKFDRIETRTTDQAGDNATYTKTPTTTTVTVARDLEAYGVVVGDVFEGTDPEFTARIMTITSGVSTTLTLVNDNGLSTGIGVAIDDWYIRSKDLTDREYATKVGDYPASIINRRFRNVYPDSHEVIFTDTTDPTETSGFYGGGDVTQTVEGYYGAVIETAKRSQQRAAQSLTKLNGPGIYKVLNPFGTSQDLNDIVIDGGNYLLDQLVVGGSVAAVRALSTDTSEIFKLEDSVTVQIDYFAKLLRINLRPLLGPYNIDEGPYFDLISATINAVITKVVDVEKKMSNITFLEIKVSETAADTIEVTFEVLPYVAASKILVTIFI